MTRNMETMAMEMAQNMTKEKEDAEAAAAEPAPAGPSLEGGNAGMWAEYMSLFQDTGDSGATVANPTAPAQALSRRDDDGREIRDRDGRGDRDSRRDERRDYRDRDRDRDRDYRDRDRDYRGRDRDRDRDYRDRDRDRDRGERGGRDSYGKGGKGKGDQPPAGMSHEDFFRNLDAERRQREEAEGRAKALMEAKRNQDQETTMRHDPATGYLRCSVTKLYYDANTSYFFTSATGASNGRFYVYDQTIQKLTEVDRTGEKLRRGEQIPWPPKKKTDTTTAKPPVTWEPPKVQAAKQGKVKESTMGLAAGLPSVVAAPGAVTVLQSAPPQPTPAPFVTQQKPAFQFNMPPQIAQVVAQQKESPPASESKPSRWGQGTAAATGASDRDVEDEFICHVCMRKFNSREQLTKHEQFSDLHKRKVAERDALAAAQA